jgi:hypothetical protein
MINERFYSHLSANFKRHMGFISKRDWSKRTFRLSCGAAGETENIQNWLKLDGDPGFQLLHRE